MLMAQNQKPKKRNEVAIYLLFGTLTTAVAMLTYFGVLKFGESVLSIDSTDNLFYLVRVAAELLQWIAAVAFAFFTNKFFVFTDADRDVPWLKQLLIFACGRLITLALDTMLTLGAVKLLHSAGFFSCTLELFAPLVLDADFIAKMIASVVVVITNYFISKYLVFKNKK